MNDEPADAAHIKAWQCIGCGKIEAPQTCIGVCQDRRIELVNADEYRAAQARIKELETLIRQLALTTPRTGEWERSYRALQTRARQTLEILVRDVSTPEALR